MRTRSTFNDESGEVTKGGLGSFLRICARRARGDCHGEREGADGHDRVPGRADLDRRHARHPAAVQVLRTSHRRKHVGATTRSDHQDIAG